MAIQDFGKKIGGAKKDLWKLRGLRIDDLLEMNDAEKIKFIKKDNVWKKPDYQALVDSGIPVRVVYFMKMMRDATPTKPAISYADKTPEQIEAKQNGYIEFVGKLRDAVLGLKTEQEVLHFYKDFLDQYIIRKPGSYYVDISAEAYGCIDNKMLKAARVSDFRIIDRDIQKKQFCYSSEDKEKAAEKAFLSLFEKCVFSKDTVTFQEDYYGRTQVGVKVPFGTKYFYPTGEDADPASYEEGKVFILQRGKVIAKNLESMEAAQDLLKKLYAGTKEKQAELEKEAGGTLETGKKRKKGFVPKQLEDVERDGEDYRGGKQACGEDYMKVFRFRGGEFGNWMNEQDRQASLDFGYDALLDMSKALGIAAEDISLGGKLSIAFGARGSGNALAHYEPLREVINLTKMKGSGSLAHEWGHALDDILGKELGLKGFMTERAHRKGVPKTLAALVDCMKYKEASGPEVEARQLEAMNRRLDVLKRSVELYFPKDLTEEQAARKDSLVQALVDKTKEYSEAQLWEFSCKGDGHPEIDGLSALRKEIQGRVIGKDARKELASAQWQLKRAMDAVGKGQKVQTEFYTNSIRFDREFSRSSHGYWQSTIEMFARAFACYVKDKVEEAGGRSDYLCGHADLAVSMTVNRKGEPEVIKAFPEGEERLTLNRCFDELILELKEMELLHDYVPMKAPEKQVAEPERKKSLEELIGSGREIQAKQKEKAKVAEVPLKEKDDGQLEFFF